MDDYIFRFSTKLDIQAVANRHQYGKWETKNTLHDSSAFGLPCVITLFRVLLCPEPPTVAAFPSNQTRSPLILGYYFFVGRLSTWAPPHWESRIFLSTLPRRISSKEILFWRLLSIKDLIPLLRAIFICYKSPFTLHHEVYL